MKKFLILLLTPLLLAACNDDEEFTPDAGAYVCSLRVTDASTGQPTLEDTGIECLLTEQLDKSISLTMKDVKFSTSPHEPSKTIVFPRLASRSEAGETTIYGIGNDGIVPEIGDLPRPDFVIEEFECTLTDDSNRLRIAFICKNTDYRLNHKAEFEGTRKLK